jgi:hypothetical protein
MGVIEYKVLLIIVAYGSFIFAILSLCNLDVFVSISIFIFFFAPPSLLLIVGFRGEPFIPFLYCLYKFYINSNIYLYKSIAKTPKKRYYLYIKRGVQK